MSLKSGVFIDNEESDLLRFFFDTYEFLLLNYINCIIHYYVQLIVHVHSIIKPSTVEKKSNDCEKILRTIRISSSFTIDFL